MQSEIFGRRARAIKALFLVTAVMTSQLPVEADEPLFASDEIFDLTVHAPISKLLRRIDDRTDVTGRLELDDETSIPMTCNKYGISRLRECDLASLEITVDESDVRGTPFEGLRTLRLVTPCRLKGDYDKYIVLEYLVYKIYSAITEPALRARLVRVRFHDSEKRARDETGYAIFIEDIAHAAIRNNQAWLDIQAQELSDLDAAELTLMTLFQFMVANTDWSAVRGHDDDRCCHNVAVLSGGGAASNSVVPYDFDQAGVVNPPYAVPAPTVRIRRVTERLYRGLCVHNDLLPAAIAVFNDKRPEIEDLFGRAELPYPKDRLKAAKYVGGFFEIINDPQEFEKKIIRDCR